MLKRGVCCLALLMAGSLPAFAGEREDALAGWLQQRFPDPTGVRWEVVLLQDADNVLARGGGGKSLDCFYAGAKPKRVMDLQVRAASENRVATIKIQARRLVKAVVASELIPSGKPVGQAWHWEERDVETLPRDSIRDPQVLAGKRARKVFTQNEALTEHALEPDPAVKVGSRLTLRVRGEGVVISTDVLAMEEGQPGKWVKCKCLGSDQVLKAEIVDQANALIVLSQR